MPTIGSNFRQGSCCNIAENALIGDNVVLGNGVVIYDNVIIGSDVTIGDYSVMGISPSIVGEPDGGLVIGDGVEIYPYTLVQSGKTGQSTKIESDVRILGHTTVGYNDEIKTGSIIATGSIIGHDVCIAGSVIINARAYIKSGINIGKLSHIATIASIEHDVLPFARIKGIPPYVENVNITGLKKNGYREEEIEVIMRAFEIIFNVGLTIPQAIDNLISKIEKKSVIADIMVFLEKERKGGRGLIK